MTSCFSGSYEIFGRRPPSETGGETAAGFRSYHPPQPGPGQPQVLVQAIWLRFRASAPGTKLFRGEPLGLNGLKIGGGRNGFKARFSNKATARGIWEAEVYQHKLFPADQGGDNFHFLGGIPGVALQPDISSGRTPSSAATRA